jgi:hypothetical protein
MSKAWSTAMDTILGAFETDKRRTVFEQPGKIAQLYGELGGEQRVWDLLAVPARFKEGFFDLLLRKAHFLMLPKGIVKFMRDSSSLRFSETVSAHGSRAATTKQDEDKEKGTFSVEMRISGASQNLVVVGYDLGRKPFQAGYPILDTIYHEMTHALVYLQKSADAGIQKIYADGVREYKAAEGVMNTKFTPPRFAEDVAFSEAAAYYVGDKILRWCLALAEVNLLVLTPSLSRAALEFNLNKIAERYNAYVPEYGTVLLSEVAGVYEFEKIAKPELSANLRDAINKNILDGLPLTMPFDATPLGDLGKALLAKASPP